MNLSTLPGHKLSPEAAAAKAAAFLARRKAMHGDATMTAGTGEQQQGGENQQTGGENQQQQSAPKEAVDEHGVSLGFPAETKVEDMSADQKANYWRNQAKVQQRKVPANLTELQEAAQKWADYERSQKPPAEQQVEDVRKQTEAQVRLEVARDSALAVLRTNLHTRGKNAAEIDALLQYVNPDSFITEGKVDAGKANSYLDQIAPTGTGGGGGGLPGQGRHEQTAADRAANGKAEAERRGYKPADRSKSSLMPTTP